MDDKLVSLEKLFNQSLFRIPDYQRGYSWGETQLEEFWDDIMNMPEGNDHYTGMLSLREIMRGCSATAVTHSRHTSSLRSDYGAHRSLRSRSNP